MRHFLLDKILLERSHIVGSFPVVQDKLRKIDCSSFHSQNFKLSGIYSAVAMNALYVPYTR